MPAPELFPIDDLRASFDAALREGGGGAVQYGPTEGYLPLRAYLAARLARRGIIVEPDEILITTGSQQGLDLVGKVLLAPPRRSWWRRRATWARCRRSPRTEPRYRAAPMDDEGLRVDHVVAALAARTASPVSRVGRLLLYTSRRSRIRRA